MVWLYVCRFFGYAVTHTHIFAHLPDCVADQNSQRTSRSHHFVDVLTGPSKVLEYSARFCIHKWINSTRMRQVGPVLLPLVWPLQKKNDAIHADDQLAIVYRLTVNTFDNCDFKFSHREFVESITRRQPRPVSSFLRLYATHSNRLCCHDEKRPDSNYLKTAKLDQKLSFFGDEKTQYVWYVSLRRRLRCPLDQQYHVHEIHLARLSVNFPYLFPFT